MSQKSHTNNANANKANTNDDYDLHRIFMKDAVAEIVNHINSKSNAFNIIYGNSGLGAIELLCYTIVYYIVEQSKEGKELSVTRNVVDRIKTLILSQPKFRYYKMEDI